MDHSRKKRIAGITYVLDEFHLEKVITKLTSHMKDSRMSSRPMRWSIKGMSKMSELRAYYYNGGNTLELVRYQKENIPKAAGCEVVVVSCGQMLAQEGKNRRSLGVFADWPVYTIPYPQIKRIANFKDHIYGL